MKKIKKTPGEIKHQKILNIISYAIRKDDEELLNKLSVFFERKAELAENLSKFLEKLNKKNYER